MSSKTPPGDSKKSSSQSKMSDRSSRMEEQILKTQKLRERKQFLEEMGKRISIAREGRLHFEKSNFPDAVSRYRRFLALSARGFDVEVKDLRPEMFDIKSRVAEALLISSVSLDLLKMLDILKSTSAKEDRSLYMRLFVIFTVGQPFQGFAAENIRKYIQYTSGLKNPEDFKSIYNSVRIKRFCMIASNVFGEASPEVDALRVFRDTVLMSKPTGRAFVSWYYENGPLLLKIVTKVPHGPKLIKVALTWFISKVS